MSRYYFKQKMKLKKLVEFWNMYIKWCNEFDKRYRKLSDDYCSPDYPEGINWKKKHEKPQPNK